MSRSLLSSGAWLVEIYEAEKRIAQVLDVVADTLALLSIRLPDIADQQLASEHIALTDTALRDSIEKFEKNVETYFTLLDDIQQLFRKQFRTMVKESIGSRVLPITLNSYGEEKELVLTNNTIALAKQMVDSTLKGVQASIASLQPLTEERIDMVLDSRVDDSDNVSFHDQSTHILK